MHRQLDSQYETVLINHKNACENKTNTSVGAGSGRERFEIA